MRKQTWLITGANRGIGRAIAEFVTEKGDDVVACARRLDSLSELENRVGNFPGKVIPVQMDMNNAEEIAAAVNQLKNAGTPVDVLVNNAGYGLQGFVEELGMDQCREQMETNFFGLLDLTQQIIPQMRERGSGYIVNISSIAGLRGTAGLGLYNASKFAVVGLTEALALELQPFGLHVSVVEPGPYRTDWAGPKSLKRSEAMAEKDENSPYYKLNLRYGQYFDESDGKQPGDPRQIASVLYSASRAEKPPVHMVFGDFAVKGWKERITSFENSEFVSLYPHEKWEV